MSPEEKLLTDGINSLGLDISPHGRSLLLGYGKLLVKWNRVFNLTSQHTLKEIIVSHLLDSLSIIPFIRHNRLIDMATGAGLPGIPIAISNPDIEVSLIESQGKRVRFLRQVAAELSIKNIVIIHSRIEAFVPETLFDTIVVRAFASTAKILSLAEQIGAPNGEILMMKGRLPEKELSQLPAGYQFSSHPLLVPGLESERHLVRVHRT